MSDSEVSFSSVARSSRAAVKRRLRSRMLGDGVVATEAVMAAVACKARLVEGFIHGTVFLLDGPIRLTQPSWIDLRVGIPSN